MVLVFSFSLSHSQRPSQAVFSGVNIQLYAKCVSSPCSPNYADERWPRVGCFEEKGIAFDMTNFDFVIYCLLWAARPVRRGQKRKICFSSLSVEEIYSPEHLQSLPISLVKQDLLALQLCDNVFVFESTNIYGAQDFNE